MDKGVTYTEAYMTGAACGNVYIAMAPSSFSTALNKSQHAIWAKTKKGQ